MNVKRISFYGSAPVTPREDPEGKWVAYEDYERDLAAMTASRDYEKVAHARSTYNLREDLAKHRGTPRQRGWEDFVLEKAGELPVERTADK